MVLTAVTKFRVSFGEVVDKERNFATMELTQKSRTCYARRRNKMSSCSSFKAATLPEHQVRRRALVEVE